MLDYDVIYIFEGIYIKRTSNLHECRICLCNYFFKINFSFQPCVYDDCHDLLKKATNFKEFAVVSVKGNIYRIYFCSMAKDYDVSLMGKAYLNEKIECINGW